MFTQHIEGAINRVPVLEKTGIKSTVCGPGEWGGPELAAVGAGCPQRRGRPTLRPGRAVLYVLHPAGDTRKLVGGSRLPGPPARPPPVHLVWPPWGPAEAQCPLDPGASAVRRGEPLPAPREAEPGEQGPRWFPVLFTQGCGPPGASPLCPLPSGHTPSAWKGPTWGLPSGPPDRWAAGRVT